LSDIHIVHDNSPVVGNSELKRQLVYYIALILHPGLVPPYPQERLMQVAYTAKLNSGCISRQVGAVVTNSDYSVKSIGWNTVGKGHTPCSLRSFDYLNHPTDINAFSTFELKDEKFREVVKIFNSLYLANNSQRCLNGVPLSYCFKDFYTFLKKGQKNQVHTRSLHAEENAFLQLAKYGSSGIEGGFLFTTASPCELCAKKAYQLGIRKVYYIDIYPGISQDHILSAGEKPVEMIQFRGVIGRAYQSLYEPLFPLKDEIEYLTAVKVKFEESAGGTEKQTSLDQDNFKSVSIGNSESSQEDNQ
jgi:deoxycytidylate deaminase